MIICNLIFLKEILFWYTNFMKFITFAHTSLVQIINKYIMTLNLIKILWVIVLPIIILFACKHTDQGTKNGRTDLMKYGVPYSIKAPADIQVTKIGQGDLTDVSVKNNSGYDVQIFMGSARSSDISKIKENKKVIFASNPFFSKIVEEYEDGYLFEKTNQEGKKSYDFIIIKVIGSNEINFQCGNSKEFSEKEVKEMVKSIRD